MTHTVRQGSGTPLGIPVYALGTNPDERDRLRRQAEELRDHSAALLDRVGIERDWSAIDLGCGPRGIVDLLADRVGPAGRVTGLEYNPDSVALAREFAVSRGKPANSRLRDLLLVIEADARPLLEALIGEINLLLFRVRRTHRQRRPSRRPRAG